MKPIKLIMNAFGSFLETTEIDFTTLNNSGFYLITGPTGSGKTTIFDAIMFALYGEASGDTRSIEGFRSDFAEDKNPTYVEFTFEKDNIIYKITRSPRYSVEYRATPLEAKASLVYEDKVIEKTNFVNEAINEIIGLTSSQFKQVIMLAQGEFMKLIHAKSSERDEIFRKIFGTEVFEKVSKLLKEETKEIKDKLKLNEELIRTLIVNIPDYELYQNYNATVFDLNNTTYLLEELDNKINDYCVLIEKHENNLSILANALINLNTEKETAKLINDDFNTLTKEEDKLKHLDEQKELIKLKTKQIKNLNEVSKIKPFYDRLINVNLQINILSKTYETNKAILEEKQETLNCFIDQTNMIELDRISLENLKKAKVEIEKNILVKQEIETKLTKITSLEQQLLSLNKSLELLSSEQVSLSKKIEDTKLIIKDLSKYNLEYELTLRKIEEVKELIKELEKINSSYLESLQINNKITVLVDEYNSLFTIYTDLYQKYLLKEQSYFNNLAGVLAKGLKEGNACPVCGSLTHPHLASISCDVVSKETLDKEFDAVENIRTQKDAKMVEIEAEKAKYNAITKQLLKNLNITDEQAILAKINEIKENNTTSLEKLNIYKEECQQAIIKLNNLEKENNLNEEKLNTNSNVINELNKQITTINNDKAILKGAIETLESQLTFSNSIEELELAIEERNEAIEMLDAAITGFDQEFDLAKEEHQLIKGKLDENINQLTLLKEQQDNVICEYNKVLEELSIKKDIIDDIEIYIADLVNLSNYVKEVTEYNTEYKTCSKIIKDLTKKLDGKSVININELEQVIYVKEKEIDELKEQINNLNNVLNKQKQVFKDLTTSFKQYKELILEHEDLSLMSLAANGQNKKYLSFERYVLVEYFDNILNHANYRLKKMTNGRYLLYRKVDKSKGRAQQGLDMEIFDFETGKRRDVKTLSGGETFKAALSLALGLADAIENKVGNITIDTLFIDEGFGTLDEESLNQAIEILLELNNDNKSIGIISHVQELKDLIPTKLIVSKTDNGSMVKIVE